MIRYRAVDDTIMRTLERHEIRAHAIPNRAVRDLGHSVLLHDPSDADPFWNRLQSVRWPSDEDGFEARLTDALALFLALGRQPHIWPSPVHSQPADLVERLAANGFRDVGGGHVMVLEDVSAAGPVRPTELGHGVTLHAIRTPADADERDPDDMGNVLAEGFGALPERGPELASDLRRTLDDPRVALALVRVDGEAAACAKATSFEGYTYLSSIATRDAFRGRGLAGLATRHVLAAAGARDAGRSYLGVSSGNEPAIRLYTRLGFASVGESPDMLLG